MKVVLILSLALVLLASVSFAARSRVILPAYAREDITHEKRETVVEGVEQEPDRASNPFRAIEVDDGDQPKVVPLVSAFGLKKSYLQELYQEWLPKVPAGEDSSFPEFLDWLKEQAETKEQEETEEQEESEEKEEPENSDESDQGDGDKASSEKKEYVADQQQFAVFQRSADEEQPEISLQEIAKDFGLTEAELEDLYRIWVPKVPAGEDKSFQAFINWMDENNEPEDDDAPRVVTEDKRDLGDWFKKMGKAFTQKNPRELEEDQQQNIVNGQESLAARDLQPSFKPGPKSAITEDKRDLGGWFKKMGKAFTQKNPRELEEDQQQNIVNGQESMAERDLQPSFKPGPKSATFDGQKLFDAYRKWLKTVGEGKDKTFQKFAKLFNNRNSRSLENELSDESQITDTERREGEEEEKEVLVEEAKPDDTNGGYSCEENSPCNIENIANEQFYFATGSSDKFIQCDASGGCRTLACEDGLVWDDEIKTCGLRI